MISLGHSDYILGFFIRFHLVSLHGILIGPHWNMYINFDLKIIIVRNMSTTKKNKGKACQYLFLLDETEAFVVCDKRKAKHFPKYAFEKQ